MTPRSIKIILLPINFNCSIHAQAAKYPLHHPASSSKKKSRREPAQDPSTSHNTRKKLLDFISRTAELERKLEIIKEMLA